MLNGVRLEDIEDRKREVEAAAIAEKKKTVPAAPENGVN